MIRFLVSSYSAICEIALWVLFVGAAISGWYTGGAGGLIASLIATFLFSVFFIAPFVMLDDIRKSTLRLERIANVSLGHDPAPPTQTRHSPSGASPLSQVGTAGKESQERQRIKVFKGKEIFKETDGVSVDGKAYPGLLAAEKAISDQEKSLK